MKTDKVKTFTIAKGLPLEEGRKIITKKALASGGDYRGITYNPKTGKGTAR